MKLLADTQVLIWSALSPEKTPRAIQSELEDETNEIWFSVVSLWEVAIKFGLKKPGFSVEPGALRQGLFDAGFQELSLDAAHVLAFSGLPILHKDPFDRLLLGQAIAESMSLVTTDLALANYPGPIWRSGARN